MFLDHFHVLIPQKSLQLFTLQASHNISAVLGLSGGHCSLLWWKWSDRFLHLKRSVHFEGPDFEFKDTSGCSASRSVDADNVSWIWLDLVDGSLKLVAIDKKGEWFQLGRKSCAAWFLFRDKLTNLSLLVKDVRIMSIMSVKINAERQ